MQNQLKISGEDYKQLKAHLYPGDGLEAVAVALCGRHTNAHTSVLLVHRLIYIPHEECVRERDYINWKTERIIPLLEEAEKNDMAIVKFHSHPGGYAKFSDLDNASDKALFDSVFGWCDSDNPHGSCIMLPNGQLFGRVFLPKSEIVPIHRISVVADRIKIFDYNNRTNERSGFEKRNRQAFGDATMDIMKGLKVAVVGCSGTGSPTIEQLARLGVGELVLVDPDIVEEKNLNRIINATLSDAKLGLTKVAMLKSAVEKMGLGTKVTAFDKNLYESAECLNALFECDVIFGCVDSVEGRHLLSHLSTFYLIPYFDLGVKLQADGLGGIDVMVGSVHYIQPGLSSLRSRRVYSSERLREEGLKRQSPQEYEALLAQKYIKGVDVERPAVIGINMLISSFGINEFLNRLHPFKDEAPGYYGRVMIDYCGGTIENTAEETFELDLSLKKWVGRGKMQPLLRILELGTL